MKKILAAICVLNVGILLVAGLWPFNPFLRNTVAWLSSRNGLRFGAHGTAVSSGRFDFFRLPENSRCSFEIALQPASAYAGNSFVILDFYAPDNPMKFRLLQWQDELLIRRNYRDSENRWQKQEIEIEHAFRNDEPTDFLITGGAGGVSAYRNGELAQSNPNFALPCSDFAGQLILGNSPSEYSPWRGDIFGMGIFQKEFSQGDVNRHRDAWTNERAVTDISNDGALALFLFAERSGKIAHNSAAAGPGAETDLNIPDTFKIFHKRMLSRPWQEFSPDATYAKDVAINILGFVPFGFFFCAYLAWIRNVEKAWVFTIIAGAAISVTIEILQIFIPSRTSGITDILTNSMGTALGMTIWSWGALRSKKNSTA